MDAFRIRKRLDHSRAWNSRIKDEAYEKVLACPLMHACALGGNHPRALFGGFWHFVNAFPAIIRDTYTNVPSAAANDPVRRFLRRSAPILSGPLRGMEEDERAHRALWIRSAGHVGLSPCQLEQWKVLSEIRSLTRAIRTERQLARRLLYFVAVEIVAEGIARYLFQAPRMVQTMGEDGMRWFAVHLVQPGATTTHEALAFNLAMSLKRAARERIDEESVNADIRCCVDWFFAGGVACSREFGQACERK